MTIPSPDETRRTRVEQHNHEGMMTMSTTTANYGDLHDYVTGDYIRPATAVEAEESSTQSGDEGIIYADGRECYVDGPAVLAGQIIQHDISGVGQNWQAIKGVISVSVSSVLRAKVEASPAGGKTWIRGMQYRWGH